MTRRLTIDDISLLAVPESPALSPDATHIAYVLRSVDVEEDRNVRSIWCVPALEGPTRQLTHGPVDTSPAWSPDGHTLAFLRAQDGPSQLWLLPTNGGEAEQYTTLPLGAGPPVWSPDGAHICFAAEVDSSAVDGENEAARTRRATAPIVADRPDYQADGEGFTRTVHSQLHVLTVATKHCRQITNDNLHAIDPAWAPDGMRIAFTGGADLTNNAPVYIADLRQDASSPTLTALPDGVAGPILWTTDSSALLVVGIPSSPQGFYGLLRVPLDGSSVVNLAQPLDRNVVAGAPGYPGSVPHLSHDDGVIFCIRDRGHTHLYRVRTDGTELQPVFAPNGCNVLGMSVRHDTAAIVVSTPTSYGEVVTLDLTSRHQAIRTQHGDNLADVELFVREEREFTVSDGTVIHGWITRDPSTQGRGPLLLDIHGGPHQAWHGAADGTRLYHQVLADRGWTILQVNPRGSDGYGELFHNATIGAWGTDDVHDFLEPIETLVSEGIADSQRLAVTGYSYGGYMTAYLTSRTDRFAVAVAGAMISDLTSMVGTSDGGHFISIEELAGHPWDQPSRYAKMSPLTHVDDVVTPTLILHGITDQRCPIGQAQQWHWALNERNIPTSLVLYPGASHGFVSFGKPSHRTDYNQRLVSWVEQHVKRQ